MVRESLGAGLASIRVGAFGLRLILSHVRASFRLAVVSRARAVVDVGSGIQPDKAWSAGADGLAAGAGVEAAAGAGVVFAAGTGVAAGAGVPFAGVAVFAGVVLVALAAPHQVLSPL
jgi:hypothetical protein